MKFIFIAVELLLELNTQGYVLCLIERAWIVENSGNNPLEMPALQILRLMDHPLRISVWMAQVR